MSTSSSTTNNTEVLGDHQEGNHNVETEISSDNKSKDVTEMSLKQLQVITFLSKIEGTLKNYLKEEQSFDYKVLQNVIKDLAVILKTGEKETQQFVEEMLNKDDNKILSLLVRASFSLFKGILRTYMYLHMYMCTNNYIFAISCVTTYVYVLNLCMYGYKYVLYLHAYIYICIYMRTYVFKEYCLYVCSYVVRSES